MGIYKAYTTYNGYTAYHGPGSNRLYYAHAGTGGWLIGPSLGSPTGYIYNASHSECPYMIVSGWMFVLNGNWVRDDTLVVRCIA